MDELNIIYEARDAIIETTPPNITLKQGGAVWLISTLNGLLRLNKSYANDYTPVTVFVRERGNVRVHVLWMHSNGAYLESEF